MYRQAVTRLTMWYVVVIAFVCLIFSVSLYSITTYRLERGAKRQGQLLQEQVREDSMPLMQSRFEEIRQMQLENDKRELIKSLILIDLIIITTGAVLSYYFAKKTMRPIEASHESQKRFTTDASHELRTPLATMQAEIEVALRNPKLTLIEAREILSNNLEDSKKLSSLSEQLLLLSRVTAKDVEMGPVDISSLLEQNIHQQKITIEQSIEPSLYVRGNSPLLATLFSTIIENAVKYSPKSPHITVTVKKSNNVAVVCIADNGIGIAKNELPRIFERFYRSRSAVRKANGHGLGLAIARDITVLHNGKLSIGSEEKKGTTVTIRLPLTQDH